MLWFWVIIDINEKMKNAVQKNVVFLTQKVVTHDSAE